MSTRRRDLYAASKWLWSRYVPPRRRWQLLGLGMLMICGGLAELMTLGALVPLLGVLAGQAGEQQHSRAADLLDWTGLDLPAMSLPTLAGLFCAVALGAAAIRIVLAWASQSLVFRIGSDVAISLYERMLHQSYSFHVDVNSSRVLAEVHHVNTLVARMLLPLVQSLSAVIIGSFIVAGLMLIDAKVALLTLLVFALMYGLISLWARPRLHRNATLIRDGTKASIQAVQEGLGGIRDVLLDNSQQVYVGKFKTIDMQLRRAQSANALIAAAPRFIVEALAMIFIAGVALLLARQGSITAALPLLAALALGGQRLLPLLQAVYYGWTSVMGHLGVFLSVADLLRRPLPPRFEGGPDQHVTMKRELRVDGLCFRYTPGGPDILRDISLSIPRGGRVGFIGPSGSGKTTLADLLMGLLLPTGGDILVDGVALDENRILGWQRNIAHVSQHIFLADASVAENVAFGVPRDAVDPERVVEACKLAQLDAFISSLPEGYDTLVGERGIRLSGGQRQRIGLARALYRGGPILVLDEATSALDDATEGSITAAVRDLGDAYTVIIIAHRLTSLSDCDTIYQLDRGRIVQHGSYTEIVSEKQRPATRRSTGRP